MTSAAPASRHWLQRGGPPIAGSTTDPLGAALRQASYDAWTADCHIDPLLHVAALHLCADVGKRLHDDGSIERLFGRPIPIVVHDLETYPEQLRATLAANTDGLAPRKGQPGAC